MTGLVALAGWLIGGFGAAWMVDGFNFLGNILVDTRSCPLDRTASFITINFQGHPGSSGAL